DLERAGVFDSGARVLRRFEAAAPVGERDGFRTGEEDAHGRHPAVPAKVVTARRRTEREPGWDSVLVPAQHRSETSAAWWDSSHGSGSVVAPWSSVWISKCRCGPVELPLLPT